jgi:hypothetical protein
VCLCKDRPIHHLPPPALIIHPSQEALFRLAFTHSSSYYRVFLLGHSFVADQVPYSSHQQISSD